MTTGWAGIAGGVPQLTVGPGNKEAEKYGRMWERPEYRQTAPGEALAATFLQQARPPNGAHVIDFGAGTGRGALMLAILGNCRVTMLDFVRNSLDPEIKQALETQSHMLRFVKHDLEQPIQLRAQYGYCTDVMEHIPPDKVDQVLGNILLAAQHVFFSISTVEDHCGGLIDETLHLSVHPPAWWLAKFAAAGCLVHWTEELSRETTDGTYKVVGLLAYVTAWASGRDIAEKGVQNTGEDQIRENVKRNLQGGWLPVVPHPTNDVDCMIVGSGPTLAGFADEIRAHRAAGVKLITLNGAYNWALDHGLTPSLQIVADAREFNKRFTRPVVDGCKYMIASQCDPAVFEGLPPDRTYIWHMNPAAIADLLNEYAPAGWYCVPGGSTVLLRAIPLLRMLGFKRFHLYGIDSCLMPATNGNGSGFAHHAIPQPENDAGIVIPVIVNAPGATGRVFYGHPWMISQAAEFLEVVKVLGDVFELEVHGDGLLAHILEVGAASAALDPVPEEATTP